MKKNTFVAEVTFEITSKVLTNIQCCKYAILEFQSIPKK